MGAWDYGPFDNDDASGFIGTITNHKDPVKYIHKVLNGHSSYDENERRAVAAFIHFVSKFSREELQDLVKLSQLVDEKCDYDFSDFRYNVIRKKNPVKYTKRALTFSGQDEEQLADKKDAALFVKLVSGFDRRSLPKYRRMAVDVLVKLRRDPGFTEDWKSPAAVKRKLNKEIKDLGCS